MSHPTVIYCEQGGPEWHLARRGRITASRFREVVTGTPAQWCRILDAIRAEAAMPEADFLALVSKPATTGPRGWGHAFEPKARAYYSFLHDVNVETVGLCIHPDDDLIACSPDGLVGEDGGLEVKCSWDEAKARANAIHGIDPLLYGWQVQGCLWVTGRRFWDCVAYDPRATGDDQFSCRRVCRDDNAISALAPKVQAFAAHLRNGTNPSIHDPRTDDVPRLF